MRHCANTSDVAVRMTDALCNAIKALTEGARLCRWVATYCLDTIEAIYSRCRKGKPIREDGDAKLPVSSVCRFLEIAELPAPQALRCRDSDRSALLLHSGFQQGGFAG